MEEPEKILNYRSLTKQEIEMVNELKELELQVLEALSKARIQVYKRYLLSRKNPRDELLKFPWTNDLTASVHLTESKLWHEKALMDLQTGFMEAIRMITIPQPYTENYTSDNYDKYPVILD